MVQLADNNKVGGLRVKGVVAWGAVSGTLLPCAIALCGVASAGSGAPSARPLPAPLRIVTPRLEAALESARGSVRVVITLRAQPVLRAAQRGRVAAAIAARLTKSDHRALASARSARTVSQRKAFARALALHALAPQARRAERLVVPLEWTIVRAGGRLETFDPAGGTLTARVPARALPALAARRDVASIARLSVRRPLSLSDTVSAVGAPSFWSGGYTGGQGSSDSVPATLWIDDNPIDLSHPDLHGVNWENLPSAYTTQACGGPTGIPQPNCDHGTHVASLAIGQGVDAADCPSGLTCAASDAQQKGVAYGIAHAISSQGGPNPPSGCAYGIFGFAVGIYQTGGSDCSTPRPGATWPAQVTNESYGNVNPTAANLSDDSISSAYNLLPVTAAGNEGPGAGTVDYPCVGYDTLCVGSYEMGANLVDPSDDTISDWSSRGTGPSPGSGLPDVKKPDLVAVGDTTLAEESYTYKNALWTAGTGTSFAAPLVSGAAALLVGSGVTDHLAVKAILIDSARPGRASPSSAMGTQTTWQPDWGWGELDLQDALAQRTNFMTGSVPGGSARFYEASAAASDRATLVWDQRVTGYCNAAYCGDPSAVTQSLTNLDLVQRDASTSAVQMSSKSLVDSVEQVRSPSAGQVVYVVRATSSVDGADAEPFALAATNALTEIQAPEPQITTSLSATRVRQGDPVTVSAHLVNPSAALDGQNAQATLVMPAGVQLVSGSATQNLGTLSKTGPGNSADASWTVTGTADELADLQVVATTQAYGETLRSQADAGSVLFDSTPPSVSLSAPAGQWQDPQLDVSWDGQDGGSGLDHFDVQLAVDGGEYQPWLEPTTDTAATYSASYGHSYSFRVRAVDREGNASAWTASQPVTLVDPNALAGSGATCSGCGVTSTPMYTTTTWTPSPSPSGSKTTTTTTPRLRPGLRITSAKIAGRYVIVRGTLRLPRAVVVSATTGRLRVIRRTRPATRFTVHLLLPRGSRARRVVVRARSAGHGGYLSEAARRVVRR